MNLKNLKRLMEKKDSVITFLKFLKFLGVVAVIGNFYMLISGNGFLVMNLINIAISSYGTVLAHIVHKLMDSVLGKIGGMMV